MKSNADRRQPQKARALPDETKTCRHCRYEYPADEPRCTICGYPWPWLSQEEEKQKGG